MDIGQMLTFIRDNAIALGILGTAITGVINFWQFVKVRKAELRQKEYENYHQLIEKLNIPRTDTGHPLLDMQLSAIFELRYYPRYKELTYRILCEWIVRSDEVAEVGKETLRILKVPYPEDYRSARNR